MPVEAFIDTNIFVYSVSSHSSEKEKRDKARELLGAVDFGTSAQVLGEFYVTATQKIAEPLSEAQALHFIARLARLPIVGIDADLVLQAIALKTGASCFVLGRRHHRRCTQARCRNHLLRRSRPRTSVRLNPSN